MSLLNGWYVVAIPAIAEEDESYQIGPGRRDVYRRRAGELLLPGRETPETLDRVRRALGSINYFSQYQQRPIPPGGTIIQRDWIKTYEVEPQRFDRKIVSVDAASTTGNHSSYSVITVVGLKGLYLYVLDVHRGRWEVPELQRRIVDVHRSENADVTVIETGDVGRAIAQSLREANLLAPALRRPRLDKEARLLRHVAKFENGQVLLPEEAPWLAGYLAELLAFPQGRYDDQVDSTTQALTELSRYRAIRTVSSIDGMYGPTGRRTRASLTRRAPQPEPDEFELDPPTEPLLRVVPAEWEPEHDVTRPRRRR